MTRHGHQAPRAVGGEGAIQRVAVVEESAEQRATDEDLVQPVVAVVGIREGLTLGVGFGCHQPVRIVRVGDRAVLRVDRAQQESAHGARAGGDVVEGAGWGVANNRAF